jgi:hypothetical protein
MIVTPETYLVKAFKKDGSFEYRSVEMPVKDRLIQVYPDKVYHTEQEVKAKVGSLCYENGYSSYILEGRLKYSFVNERN